MRDGHVWLTVCLFVSLFMIIHNKKACRKTPEMAQQVKVIAAESGDTGLILKTHVVEGEN